jgi:hypothetical protein
MHHANKNHSFLNRHGTALFQSGFTENNCSLSAENTIHFCFLINCQQKYKGQKVTQRASKHSQNMFVMTLCGEVYSAILCLSSHYVSPKIRNMRHFGSPTARRRAHNYDVFFLSPQVCAVQVHFGARVPAVQWGANKRQCAQVTADSHSEAGVSEIP